MGAMSRPLSAISFLARVESNDSITVALPDRIPSKKAATTSSGFVGFLRLSAFIGTIASKLDALGTVALLAMGCEGRFGRDGVDCAAAGKSRGVDWAVEGSVFPPQPRWPTPRAIIVIQKICFFMSRFHSRRFAGNRRHGGALRSELVLWTARRQEHLAGSMGRGLRIVLEEMLPNDPRRENSPTRNRRRKFVRYRAVGHWVADYRAANRGP